MTSVPSSDGPRHRHADTIGRVKKSLFAALVAVTGVLSAGAAHSEPVPTPWHLDRINQAALPLDGDVSMGPLTGAGIDIYIVDSGARATHEQFGGRVVAGIDLGYDLVTPPTNDCDGHGTHVSALAAGSSVGVATQARIVSVRVLDCSGEGEVSDVVRALRWVRAHHVSGRAAVVNLSLGVDIGDNGDAIEAEVHRLVDEGVVAVVAAGNGDGAENPLNACDISPGHRPEVLTVAASTALDGVANYSNYGSCVDLYAPGGNRTGAISSAWIDNDSDYNTEIGTSMSAPLVSGYVAMLAQQQPTLCVPQFDDAVVARATQNALVGVPADTPNRLLRIDPSVITATSTPGMPTNVVLSTGKNALSVSWSPPCDGGRVVTSTVVKLMSISGRTVKKVSVPAGVLSYRFTGLRAGLQYKVVVKAKNALGDGVATARITSPPVRYSFARTTYLTTGLARVGEPNLALKWKVLSGSRAVCRTVGTSKIRFTAAGTCKVRLRMVTDGPYVTRSFIGR